jgi:hypothetical protein
VREPFNCTAAQFCSIDFLNLTGATQQAKIIVPDISAPLVSTCTCYNCQY